MEPALLYVVTILTLAGIYAALTLGLNLQWGLTGLMNFGVLGFVAARRARHPGLAAYIDSAIGGMVVS